MVVYVICGKVAKGARMISRFIALFKSTVGTTLNDWCENRTVIKH